MSDLTERLRRKAERNRHARWPHEVESCEDELDEAADEIERLQAIVSADCETQDCGHAAKWLAYRNPINPRSERYCVFCEIERLTRERDAARKALHEFGLDFRRVLHDARFLYGRCLAATIGVPKLDYLEEPEAQT